MNTAFRKIVLDYRISCCLNLFKFRPGEIIQTTNIHFLLNKAGSNYQLIAPTVVPLKSIAHTQIRTKKKLTKASNEDSDEETDDDDGGVEDKGVAQIRVQSTRLDALLKTGLGISRNKIEKLFYQSKVRLNGKKVTKKSAMVISAAELDIIKGTVPENSNLITVDRVEIISVKVIDADNITISLRRSKNLIIENYDGSNRFTNLSE